MLKSAHRKIWKGIGENAAISLCSAILGGPVWLIAQWASMRLTGASPDSLMREAGNHPPIAGLTSW